MPMYTFEQLRRNLIVMVALVARTHATTNVLTEACIFCRAHRCKSLMGTRDYTSDSHTARHRAYSSCFSSLRQESATDLWNSSRKLIVTPLAPRLRTINYICPAHQPERREPFQVLQPILHRPQDMRTWPRPSHDGWSWCDLAAWNMSKHEKVARASPIWMSYGQLSNLRVQPWLPTSRKQNQSFLWVLKWTDLADGFAVGMNLVLCFIEHRIGETLIFSLVQLSWQPCYASWLGDTATEHRVMWRPLRD